MSEEEIIIFLEEYKKTGYNTLYIKNNGDRHKTNIQIENAIQGILDLYQKEKNKELVDKVESNLDKAFEQGRESMRVVLKEIIDEKVKEINKRKAKTLRNETAIDILESITMDERIIM